MRIEVILSRVKAAAKQRYMERMAQVAVPVDVEIPADPREALLMGMRLGKREAYEEGLLDGVRITMDVEEEELAESEATRPVEPAYLH